MYELYGRAPLTDWIKSHILDVKADAIFDAAECLKKKVYCLNADTYEFLKMNLEHGDSRVYERVNPAVSIRLTGLSPSKKFLLCMGP